jgi:8-oxo-dGTP diphosphatase
MSTTETQQPRIGVGVMVIKEGRVLVCQRMNGPHKGCWQFPGGKLEWYESVEDCAIRETKEESGVDIADVTPLGYTNDIFKDESKHYVTLFVVARYVGGVPTATEPEKCANWRWVSWEEFPEPKFLPIVHLEEQGIDLAGILRDLSLLTR